MQNYQLLTGNIGIIDHLSSRPVTGPGWRVNADMDDDGQVGGDQARLVSPDGEILATLQLIKEPRLAQTVRGLIERHMQDQGAEPEASIEPPRPAPAEVAAAAEIIREIPLADIGHFPGGNMRETFNRLDELAETIREHGILQPLTVNQRDGRYTLIAGERRLRAAGMAGLPTVPCRVMTLTDERSIELMLIENIQREDVTPIEEARSYRRLMALPGASQGSVAKRVGKSRPHVAEYLQLLDLPADLRHQVATGALAVKAGLEFIRRTRAYPDIVREQAAKAMVAEQPSVREAAQVIERAVADAGVARATPPRQEPSPEPGGAGPAPLQPAPPPKPPSAIDTTALLTEVADTLNRMLLDQAVRASWCGDLIGLVERIEAAMQQMRKSRKQ